jgi:hypothetical protein
MKERAKYVTTPTPSSTLQASIVRNARVGNFSMNASSFLARCLKEGITKLKLCFNCLQEGHTAQASIRPG